ncbi:PIN domain-containing protein [Candidatus Thiosymbion oneisti]|uniref:PIN domain-containing protein n=1 Tax=Candidatus Thiosymbion oneisti TaxID=589554 RepID=UPI00105EB213|nr:PIN domain-containing protein [Candidatus Thiosymbion oneisti]
MHGGSFIDTNIWIYAHLRKPGEPRHGIALELVENLNAGVISPQVVAEYYSVMLRSGQTDRWIQENLDTILSYVRLQPLDEPVVRRAWQIRDRYGFSIWDSQIIAAALESGCRTLYTEDLQHSQRIESLEIVNPLQG